MLQHWGIPYFLYIMCFQNIHSIVIESSSLINTR